MRFLFIPGSCHGPWCWRDVLPFFNNAHAIDLPHGPDATLAAHATAIAEHLPEPTILVGHSAGGFAITAAAEAAPDRVAGLIHVCAYVPRDGESLAQMRRAWPDRPLSGSYNVNADRTLFSFDPARIDALFYHDCPAEARALAHAHLRPEPIRPQETALSLRHSPHLPRAYIRCTEDRAIPPAFQSAMASGLPQIDLPSSHSPFFSMPERLAQAIHRLAKPMTRG
ncbi:Pimeloyl-ACP methyl ester carboxylesterase [Gemmobacter aquatilis]|uniref:Pimeloyl-ACP methyl ester carboxylesterase n=1 Tax=Gemmobacter aquatilis TaxID=933059 RepID=A0A1H8E5N6_9RHOB|nr:alpha/beta fold hydrolase [Gemmobacter aquatilis]SEN14802.1 Pimeloyl-ACP methyl ester carboxylesterase [Gemmobacter aquatilis]